jgi:putative acetyltransferase
MVAIAITEESPLQDTVRELLHQSNEFSQALYPPESNHLVSAEDLASEGVRFFVARVDGAIVGCGALLEVPPEGEIKRMFVTAAARGLGVGAAILRALEAAARKSGIATLRLETGIHNAAALQLYNRAGYAERGPFGDYRPDPLSVFMEKQLPPE